MNPMISNAVAAHPIRPTLFLGLGGTGKEVLLRLRRRFYERFRTNGLPCTSYLWIDTDTRDVGARGEKLDEAFSAVGFTETERISLLHGKVGESLGDIFMNRERWSFIHDWLYDEVERYGQEIGDGAGGVRAVGRLTFFGNYLTLSQRISQELTGLATLEALHATQEFYRTHELGIAAIDSSPTPVVFIVSSVAGGTGCGTYLDTAFLMRLLSRTVVNIHQMFAYLFLPNVFYNDRRSGELAERSFANAYAAFKELDFYSLRLPSRDPQGAELSIDYQVEWEKGKRLRIQGPPFSAVYLLEMRNEGGIALSHENRRDIFSMLAECLFLDLLPGAFSDGKRSDYSNITQQLAGAAGANISSGGVVLPQSFARRYATCGLSKIEIPVDAVRGACAAKLASEVFDHILRENDDANVKIDVRNDMATYRLDKQGIPDRFETVWKETIRREVSALFRNRAVANEGQIGELERDLKQLEDRLVRSESADKTKWGDVIKFLRGKTSGVSEEVKQSVTDLLRDACLENEGRGIKSTLKEGGYLDQALSDTRALYAPAEAGVPAEFDQQRAHSEADAQAWGQQKTVQLQELRTALGSLTLILLGTKEWTVAKLRERLQEAEEQYLLAKAEGCLYEEAKKVARSLADLLGEKRRMLDAFLQSALMISGRLKEKLENFLMLSSHVLFIRLFDRDKDWPQFYRLDKDEESGQMQEVSPIREYKKMLARAVHANASLLDLVELFERESAGEIEKRVTLYSEERFWRDFQANRRLVNLLDHPLMKERRQELLQRLVTSARPMLRQSGQMGAAYVQAPRFAYLGICDPTVEPYRTVVSQIDQLVRSIPGYNYHLQPQPTGNPSEIYLYFSNYAYALPSLPMVSKECHEAYADFYVRLGETSDQIPLHLSRRWEGKFDDLVVYDDNEAKTLKEVYSILLFGPVLKVLTLREVKGQHQYQYKLGAPFHRMVPLGSRRQATTVLRQNEEARSMLLAAIKTRENMLSPELVTSYYWALQASLHSPEAMPETPEHTLLTNRLDEVYKRALALGADALALDTGGIAESARFAHIQQLESTGLEWFSNLYPVLKNLEVWAKPSASAMT